MLGYLGRQHVRGAALQSWDDAIHVAEDCTQEALLAILKKLDTFRGESRFTTWAYQIAIRALLAELRRKRWQEISLERSRIGEALPGWPVDDARSGDAERALQQEQVWAILRGIIEKELTQRQRSVLIAHVFQRMPLDEFAHWLGTNRDNVYKIIHDARKKLKRCLTEHGLSQEEFLQSFGSAK